MKNLTIILSLSTIALLAFITDSWITNEICNNDIYKELVSPSSEYKAVIFERSCGSTTEISTQISIISSNKALPNSAGNVLISEIKSNNIEIRWLSAQHLEISFTSDSRIFKKENKWKDLQISYKETD